MAKITDPDDLVRGEHVAFNTSTKKITVTAGQVVSGPVQIDVVAAAGTFTRASGDFLADGWVPGVHVTFAGFTNSGNNVTKIIDTVTALVITVTDISGLVNETGGGDESASSAELDAKDGVTLKCLYSYVKEEWKNDAALIPFPFPFTPITDEQFELIDGWDFFDDPSRFLIRDGGWAVIDPVTGNPFAMWAGIISLGTIESDDQPYFQQGAALAPVDFETLGVVNQAVQIYRDDDADLNTAEGSDFDRRTFLTLFTREQGQLYDKATLDDIGVTQLTYQAYRFPLTTGNDLNIEETDGNIAANSPYTGILIRYFTAAYSRPVDSATLRDFGIVIDVGTHSGIDGSAPGGGKVLTTAEGGIITAGNIYHGGTLTIHNGANAGSYLIDSVTSGTVTLDAGEPDLSAQSDMDFVLQRATPLVATKQEIYEKIQYQLRQNADIDATGDSVTGQTADDLFEFVGANLRAGSLIPTNPNGGGSGVIIEGFDANDTNDLTFFDNGGTARTFPFVAAGSIAFNPNLQSDTDGTYWMFFEYTERFTNTGFGISGTAGSVSTLESSVTDLAAELTDLDYIVLSGFTDPGNNGLWQVTDTPAGTGPWTVEITKVDGKTPADEAAGDTVSLDKNPIDSPDAIIVNDNSGSPITGSTFGTSSAGFDFDYDNNVQGGRTAATNAAIRIRAIGLNTAQFVETSGTIQRATGQSYSLVSPLERNYANV